MHISICAALQANYWHPKYWGWYKYKAPYVWKHRGIELAKAGDVAMLKFFLDRILPRERSVRIDLPPMERADDAVDALGIIIKAVGNGEISPNEAVSFAKLIDIYARAINVHEGEWWLEKIQRDVDALRQP
jgi:hypothetical protein